MPVSVMVDGVPFFFLLNGDGWYAGAVGQRVNVNGSPVIVTFDPPIEPVPTVDAGALYQMVKGKLPA